MAHWEMGNQELPNDFRLTGAGLESELPAFVEHITNINPAMAKVFLKHLSILKEASTEEARRAARASFNSGDVPLIGGVSRRRAVSALIMPR